MGDVLGIEVDWNEEKAQAEVATKPQPSLTPVPAEPTPVTTPSPKPTSTPTPKPEPTIELDDRNRPVYTTDGLRISYDNRTGAAFVTKKSIEEKLARLGYEELRFTNYKYVTGGERYTEIYDWSAKKLIMDYIPVNFIQPSLIPLDYYYSAILTWINTLPQK